MNKELRDLMESINAKKEEARTLVNAKQLDEAKAMTNEIKNLQKEFDVKMELFETEKQNVTPVNVMDNSQKVDGVKAFFKALRGERLTDVENALLTGGANGENLIVPQDINTQINELRRQYKSARSIVGHYPTTTLTGSFVYEDISTITELTNFTDGADVPASNEPKFTPVSYAIKEYGATLPVSNVLLQNENGGLVPYLGNWFGKKATRTENKKIFAQLQAGKTVKALADWKALKSSINKDIDPVVVANTVIILNQDAFDMMDSAMDSNGRPVLQPNPVNPTQRLFMGYPVEVYSNAELPTVAGKAPIFYGDTKSGVTFVERTGYQVDSSAHAGFTKNQTMLRVIEMFDVIDADKATYMYGQLTIV